ncbi:hypothetical protein [Streptomyces spectabilis]|uniref:Uncharacterized protein n=1 Tax=Streptomyces spectabilis TaxID=68270 RepID=A0A5P2XHX8_STRST|nr:hypothetical protein [Streptomyces spectabilis]MBB5102399.1 hypothetical protein [Streptomyces spectabilis]MCI3907442.1 hypothetical protein [Streptomyces spectabilis]QEV64151.1 hypothetical protein CP982_40200 [Streptomyces spectabilis]GGV32067.1 hypothetical protein GCM10010245_52070 [Streptomyces spectabilis]
MAAPPDEVPDPPDEQHTTAMDGRVPEALLASVAREFAAYDVDDEEEVVGEGEVGDETSEDTGQTSHSEG